MTPLEIEIKFFISDIDALRKKICSAGAEWKRGGFESNIRFDDPSMRLTRERKLLRLRQDSACRLTVKTPSEDSDTGFKIFRELEVTVGDPKTMTAILGELGYFPRQVYEKERELYRFKQTDLCLDTLPFGHFMEIEGEKDDIRAVVDALCLNWEERITTNYLALFDALRKQLHLPFEDVTFENFRNMKLDSSRVHQILSENRLIA
jgi:adenylate cyclase class 2